MTCPCPGDAVPRARAKGGGGCAWLCWDWWLQCRQPLRPPGARVRRAPCLRRHTSGLGEGTDRAQQRRVRRRQTRRVPCAARGADRVRSCADGAVESGVAPARREVGKSLIAAFGLVALGLVAASAIIVNHHSALALEEVIVRGTTVHGQEPVRPPLPPLSSSLSRPRSSSSLPACLCSSPLPSEPPSHPRPCRWAAPGMRMWWLPCMVRASSTPWASTSITGRKRPYRRSLTSRVCACVCRGGGGGVGGGGQH